MIYFFVGLLLQHVSCSINLKSLSILEYTISETESTRCDLVDFGIDLPLDEDNDLQNPFIISYHGGKDADSVNMTSVILHAKCLILLMSEAVFSIHEMMHLAREFQYTKAVGVIYEIEKDGTNLAEVMKHQRRPFPIMLQVVNGK